MATMAQIIAAQATRKSQLQEQWTKAHRALGASDPLTGLTRTYAPRTESDEPKPAERKLVRYTAAEVVRELEKALVELFDTTATIDVGNTVARADVVIDGKVLVGNLPATHLLWIEKQLVDMRTLIQKMPVLDPSEEWSPSPESGIGIFVSAPVQTVSSAKVMKTHVAYAATDKHPAQVVNYNEDVPVGTWTTRKFSGMVPGTYVQQMLERVEKLQRAVKMAREEANSLQVIQVHEGAAILAYIFDGGIENA